MNTPNRISADNKPTSATCCHAIASIAGFSSLVVLVIGIAQGSMDNAMLAGGGFISAVLLWALGDIVVYLQRAATK